MLTRITRVVAANALALILTIGVAVSLSACGDPSTPPASLNQPTEVPDSFPTATEKPLDEPTEAMADSWLTFTSETGGFSVEMPGEPQTSSQTMDSALGELTFQFFLLADSTPQYMVSYNDYPADMTSEDLDEEGILNDAIQATAQGSEATNIQRIEVQGNPGIEGEANVQGSTHAWYRGILVNNRLYQMVMTAPEANKDAFADEALRFIESFRLINQ